MIVLLGLSSCADEEKDGQMMGPPKTNLETIRKFLSADAQIIQLRPHPKGLKRIGILFVIDCSLAPWLPCENFT